MKPLGVVAPCFSRQEKGHDGLLQAGRVVFILEDKNLFYF